MFFALTQVSLWTTVESEVWQVVKDDTYYHLLVPLTVPVTIAAVRLFFILTYVFENVLDSHRIIIIIIASYAQIMVNWFGLKIFKTNY